MAEHVLRARFELVGVDSESLLLDREGGGVYRLNRTAWTVWRALLDGASIPAIIDMLARENGIEHERAERDTLAVLGSLPDSGGSLPDGPFRWNATADGYALVRGESPVVEIDARGSTLRLGDGVTGEEADVRSWLTTVAPKILALRDIFVLHASAVEVADGLLIFSGRSGAGKTTTARAFARAGARLESEDLVVVTLSPEGPRAVVGGESSIRAWIRARARDLARSPRDAIPCAPLCDCVGGRRVPVAQILLLDAGRRAGGEMKLQRLSVIDSLAALLEETYFASADARDWRIRLDSLRALVRAVAAAQVTMPLGLAALDLAARAFDQRAITAS